MNNSIVSNEAVLSNLNRITNQIYKLLPSREEGIDWEKPLQTLIIELTGMNNLLADQVNLFSLLCKLEALKTLDKEEDFLLYRKTIFECLGLLDEVKKQCQ
ncbi:MAG: hypothetical protein RBR68_07465 [Tenuifilaceae bacterium]|jgi:hypothetical protein|nr:hypothetical protein [Tenuifilaceae bacterium]